MPQEIKEGMLYWSSQISKELYGLWFASQTMPIFGKWDALFHLGICRKSCQEGNC